MSCASAPSPTEHVDILIIGAGLSGIGAACRLREDHPHKRIAVLESRGASGGTWDLFRYPGIRSDSDLYTFGYDFHPWLEDRSIAEGSAILDYIRSTAREYGVDRLIRFNQRVVAADWSPSTNAWSVTVERTAAPGAPSTIGAAASTPGAEPEGSGEYLELTATWLFTATGYYRYDRPHTPEFRDAEHFEGRIVHPQFWPEDLEVTGKRIAVIGSGATAITLLPALVDRGADVTMVQRTPGYVIPLPGEHPVARFLNPRLGRRRASRLMRGLNAASQRLLWRASKAAPRLVRAGIALVNRRRLPREISVRRHFTPPYNPWDQRLCTAPDGDFFAALSGARGHIVTGGIERFDRTGLVVETGEHVAADVVVTATGFDLLLFGGAELSIDGEPLDLTRKVAYRGAMLSDIPNFVFAIGYTNASWTLKIGLLVDWFSRLLAHTDSVGAASVRPVAPQGLRTRPLLDFGAGYVRRSLDRLPRQGLRSPWLMPMSYFADRRELLRKPVIDGFLRFDDAVAPVPEQLPPLLTGPGEAGEERIVELGDGRFMCVRIDGASDAPPVVLITGLAFDLATWPVSFVHALVARGFRVIRVDNRDEGRSFRSATPTPTARQLLSAHLPPRVYAVEDMSEDVADTLHALGIERTDVIGFSLGGMIAQSLAAHRPRLVRRLVSLCSTTGDPQVGTTAVSTAAMLMLPGAPNRNAYIRGRVAVGRHLAGPAYPIDTAYEAQLAAAHWDRSLDPHGEAAAMRRQIAAIRASGNRTEVLSHITAPTLVIHGDRDRIVRPDGGPATAEAIPHARFVPVPGMGHQIHPLAVPRLLELVNEHLGTPDDPGAAGHPAARGTPPSTSDAAGT